MTLTEEYKKELEGIIRVNSAFSPLELRFMPNESGIRITHRSVNKELYLNISKENDDSYTVSYRKHPTEDPVSYVGCQNFEVITQFIKEELIA